MKIKLPGEELFGQMKAKSQLEALLNRSGVLGDCSPAGSDNANNSQLNTSLPDGLGIIEGAMQFKNLRMFVRFVC